MNGEEIIDVDDFKDLRVKFNNVGNVKPEVESRMFKRIK